MVHLVPKTTVRKIWITLVIVYSWRDVLSYYPDFYFNRDYLAAFTLDLLFSLTIYLIGFYFIPSYIGKKIRFSFLNKRDLRIGKYFILPLRKDWLFISLIGSLFVSIIVGTSLIYWWILFFLIRVYFVNKKIPIQDSRNILFISYSTHDQLIVSKIKDRLKENHNIDSWWQKDLLPTDDYEKIINEKIKESTGSIIMYSNNYEESIPIQEWELEKISNKKIESEEYYLTTCIVGNHNTKTVPFADSLQIIPSRKESLNRLDTEDFNKEIRILAKGLSSFVNIKNGISRDVYTDPRWFSFVGSFFMVGNFMYDSGLAYFFDPSIYQ